MPFQKPPLPAALRELVESPDRQLAWEFFIFFARFEYALKRTTRFLAAGHGNAEPRWDAFASAMNPHFSPEGDVNLKAAVDYFVANPPRKQLRADGVLKWSDPITLKKQPVLVWLLLCLRIVRNNLFHGGKFPLINVEDPSRNRELIAGAITVLNSCLLLDAEVQAMFFEAIRE